MQCMIAVFSLQYYVFFILEFMAALLPVCLLKQSGYVVCRHERFANSSRYCVMLIFNRIKSTDPLGHNASSSKNR